jgi:hypothetical protein
MQQSNNPRRIGPELLLMFRNVNGFETIQYCSIYHLTDSNKNAICYIYTSQTRAALQHGTVPCYGIGKRKILLIQFPS